MSKALEKLKEDIGEWSGLSLVGDTKGDLLDNLKSLHWSLECELDQEKRSFEERIKKLRIPNGDYI